MRTRRPRTRRSRTRRPRTGKKSRGKMRRRTRRPRRISKRFFMRGGDKTTNIKFLNITDSNKLISGLDKAGSGGSESVEPRKYLTVQNPEGNYLTELTINDNNSNEIFTFNLNTGENCLVIISDTENDLRELKEKIPALSKPGVLELLYTGDEYKIHKAPAGPENGDTPEGRMEYINMKSTTLKSARFSSQK
jgi:hypothetical protein